MRMAQMHEVELAVGDDKVLLDARKTGGVFERESMEMWRSVLTEDTLAIDVGAYTGIYSLRAALDGSAVFAIEPYGQAASRLRYNARANDTLVFDWTQDDCPPFINGVIVLAEAAASDKRGWAHPVRGERRLTSASRYERGEFLHGAAPFIVLDECLAGRPDFGVSAIKVDVEGYETKVLRGAKDLITKYKPLVIAEFLNDDARDELNELMDEFGYGEGAVLDKRNLVFT